MSVNGAFNAAVSGMAAQANALSAISQNIANGSTVGYQANQTDFHDIVLAGAGSGSGNVGNSLGGVSTANRINTAAGQIQSTGVSTDIAVAGNGFMVVKTSSAAGNGNYLATLAGSFRPDANGNLVNSAGYYLQGVPTDASGAAIGGNAGNTLASLSTVNINNVASSAASTTTVTIGANLPSTDTQYSATPPTPSTTSVNYYDSLGQSHTMTVKFTPSTPAAAGGAQTNTWTMQMFDDASSTPATPIGQATVAFNGGGANAGSIATVTPTTGSYNATTGDFSLTTASGTAVNVNIGAPNGTSGLTQFNGDFQTTKISTDGSSYGTLSSVSVDKNGVVQASFSNGSTRPIYQLKLATVANQQGLNAVSGDAYEFTPDAGQPLLGNPNSGSYGSTAGGSLEGSNVDITTQLTNLIETQRAYSSNATVIQTGNQMLQTAETLKQ